jgi:hypothetical protein
LRLSLREGGDFLKKSPRFAWAAGIACCENAVDADSAPGRETGKFKMRWQRLAGSLIFTLGMFIAVSCGGSGRVLESISISPNPAVAKNGTVQLVATGTFSAAPVTVTPLKVDWSQSVCDLCDVAGPKVVGPISVSAAGVATCVKGWTGTAEVQAVAPKDPNLPPDTQNVPTVRGTANLTCE